MACPFVALEDDRDARSDVPDPRHRCYAESVPAPRTLEYQERFCLSPNFAACSVFAEWAARAAARPIPGPATAPADPAPELWTERIDRAAQPAREEQWPDSMDAAPPAAAAAAATSSQIESQQLAAFEKPAATPEEPAGLAEPIVPEAVTDEPPLGAGALLAARDEEDDRGFDPAPLPTFLTTRSPRARSGSAQSVSNESVEPVAETNVRTSSSGRPDGDGDGAFTRLLTMAAVLIILALGVATVLIVPGLLSGPGATVRPSLLAGASTLPTPPASDVAVAPTSPVDASVAPISSEPVPAATPTPTPRTYKVQPGDRLRQIARQFDVTVEQILAANPEISDPNDIQVGQRILIPSP